MDFYIESVLKCVSLGPAQHNDWFFFFLADDPQNDYFVFLKKKNELEPIFKKKFYNDTFYKVVLEQKRCINGIYGIFSIFFITLNFLTFTYFWLCWIFTSSLLRGFSPAAVSGACCLVMGYGLLTAAASSVEDVGSTVWGLQWVWHAGLAAPGVWNRCGILPHRRQNPRPLHWRVNSNPLIHQASLYFHNI